MSSKARGKSIKVSLDTSGMSKFYHNYLLVYTALTLFVVLLVYAITKDWKGYTSPEEVDLGTVLVAPCRRKHSHMRYHTHHNHY